MVGLADFNLKMQQQGADNNQRLRDNLRADERLGLAGRQVDLAEQMGKQTMEGQLQDRMIKATSIFADQLGAAVNIKDPEQRKNVVGMIYNGVGKIPDPNREHFDFFASDPNAVHATNALRGAAELHKSNMDRQKQALEIQKYLTEIEKIKYNQGQDAQQHAFDRQKQDDLNQYRAVQLGQKDRQLDISANNKGTQLSVNPTTGEFTYSQGGNVDTMGYTAPTNAVNTQTQKDVIGGMEGLNQLDQIETTYNEDSLTYGGQAAVSAARFGEKMLGEKKMGGLGKETLEKNAAFESNVRSFFNAYKKEITGTAAGEREMDDLQKTLMSLADSPTEFKAKFKEIKGRYLKDLRLKRRVLREGIKVGSKEFGKRFDALKSSGEDDDPRGRALELKKMYINKAKNKQEALKMIQIQLSKEGYI